MSGKFFIVTILLILASLLIATPIFKSVQIQELDFNLSENPVGKSTNIKVFGTPNQEFSFRILSLDNEILNVVYSGTLDNGMVDFRWNGTGYDGIRLQKGKYWGELINTTNYTSVRKIIILK